MQTNIDQTKWYDRIWASYIFFTRLPFWRLHQPPKECYKTVVEHWPFLDGFGGGGSDRERILAIMKDSHIGTYGVIGLILYELLFAATLFSMTPIMAALAIMAATPYARMVAAQLVMMMPYARRAEEAKAKMVYRKMNWRASISLAIQGLLPMVAFLWMTRVSWEMVIFIPCIVMYFLYLLIWRKIHGYTGDCCGAVCLLVELTVLIVVCAQ